MDPQSLDVLAMVHLVMLSLWGGVVATEAVIDLRLRGGSVMISRRISPSRQSSRWWAMASTCQFDW